MTRNLIRDALALTIEYLHAALDERHEPTSDTQGVASSPDNAAMILAKIDAAAVFVGDVTPIAISTTRRDVQTDIQAFDLACPTSKTEVQRWAS